MRSLYIIIYPGFKVNRQSKNLMLIICFLFFWSTTLILNFVWFIKISHQKKKKKKKKKKNKFSDQKQITKKKGKEYRKGR